VSYARQLLTECFAAGGMDIATATRAADLALTTCVAAGLVAEERLDVWEREARVYHLRGQRLTVEVISARVCLGRSQVFEAIKRHQKRRRAALRQAS